MNWLEFSKIFQTITDRLTRLWVDGLYGNRISSRLLGFVGNFSLLAISGTTDEYQNNHYNRHNHCDDYPNISRLLVFVFVFLFVFVFDVLKTFGEQRNHWFRWIALKINDWFKKMNAIMCYLFWRIPKHWSETPFGFAINIEKYHVILPGIVSNLRRNDTIDFLEQFVIHIVNKEWLQTLGRLTFLGNHIGWVVKKNVCFVQLIVDKEFRSGNI